MKKDKKKHSKQRHNQPESIARSFRAADQLDAFDENKNLQVVIETPRDSRNKYAYDPDSGFFECETPLPSGMVFPYDFGFVPSTRAEDGDPLDVLVLMDEPSYPGTLVRCRLIGVIQAEQAEGNRWFRNDRLVAVQLSSIEYSDLKDWKELPGQLRQQIEHFFQSYNDARGKKFNVLNWGGADVASKSIDDLVKTKKRAPEKMQAA
jgi:inorganic pyrophosphatase